jgi:hypothetical protein
MVAALAVGSAGQGSGVVDKLGGGIAAIPRSARGHSCPAAAASSTRVIPAGRRQDQPFSRSPSPSHLISFSSHPNTLSLCFSSLQAADQRRPPNGMRSRCRRGRRHEQRCASLAAGVRAQPRGHGRGHRRRAAGTDRGASTWPARGQRRLSAQGRKAVDARTPGEEQGRMVAGPCLLPWNRQFG